MSTVECTNCGSSVPAESRFCPECGRPLQAAPARRWRLWPLDVPLALAVFLAAAGVVLLGAQLWLWGILALLLACIVFLLRWEAGRRATHPALGGMWSRIAVHRARLGARSRGQLDLFRARRDLAELQAERSRGFHELGRATHSGDASGAEAARVRLDEVSAAIAAKLAEIDALVGEMEERVRSAEAQSTPTRKLESPPEPARVPEPFPPPDEGSPPEPAHVPEPFPEPVPEPSPDDPAPSPEHPPAPQTRRRRTSRAEKT